MAVSIEVNGKIADSMEMASLWVKVELYTRANGLKENIMVKEDY